MFENKFPLNIAPIFGNTIGTPPRKRLALPPALPVKGGAICTYVGLEGKFNLPEWMERGLAWSFCFTPAEYSENIRFIAEHKIDLRQAVSDVFPLDEINAAFEKRFTDPEHSTKIVISMD